MIKNNTLMRQLIPTTKSGRRHGRTLPTLRLQNPLLSIASVLAQTFQGAYDQHVRAHVAWWDLKVLYAWAA